MNLQSWFTMSQRYSFYTTLYCEFHVILSWYHGPPYVLEYRTQCTFKCFMAIMVFLGEMYFFWYNIGATVLSWIDSDCQSVARQIRRSLLCMENSVLSWTTMWWSLRWPRQQDITQSWFNYTANRAVLFDRIMTFIDVSFLVLDQLLNQSYNQ